MTDPNRPSFADDPTFTASLDDLDRGLVGEGAGNEPVDGVARAAPPPRPERPPREHSRRPPARPIEGDESPPRDRVDRRPTPPSEHLRPPGRRPLLDLFPPSLVLTERPPFPGTGERPPGPIIGSAVGPQLQTVRRRRGAAAVARVDPPTYESFYGLGESPFGVSTDPKFFYHSAAHERVAQTLAAAISERRGVALLTGELGLGKTMVCRAVAGEFDRRTVASLQLGPVLSIDELLKSALVDFGVISRDDLARAPDVSRDVLMATLRSFLESLAPLKACAVIVIDEAQSLPPGVLAALRDVVEVGRESRLLQVVLVGLPKLAAMLKREELAPLAAQVTVRTALAPLAADEIVGYVTHRMTVAGSSGRVDFSDGAAARIHDLSRGVPRVVNLLCDRALSRGHQRSASVIDGGLIDTAAEDLDLGMPAAEKTRGVVRGLLTALTLAVLMLCGAAGALWVFRDAAARTLEQWESRPVPPGGPMRRLPVPLAPIPPPEPLR